MIEIPEQSIPPTETPQRHIGVIRVSHPLLKEELDISNTTVQGELRADSVFERVHKRLLLPASYTVLAIYFDSLIRMWRIFVESEYIPLSKDGGPYPDVQPYYYRNEDGTVRLTHIKVCVSSSGLSTEDMLKGL